MAGAISYMSDTALAVYTQQARERVELQQRMLKVARHNLEQAQKKLDEAVVEQDIRATLQYTTE